MISPLTAALLAAGAIAVFSTATAAQSQNLSGRWRLGNAPVSVTHRGGSVVMRWSNGQTFFRGSRSGSWVRGRAHIRGVHPSVAPRCPKGAAMRWVRMELVVTGNGRRLVGRYLNPNFRYALAGRINCTEVRGRGGKAPIALAHAAIPSLQGPTSCRNAG